MGDIRGLNALDLENRAFKDNETTLSNLKTQSDFMETKCYEKAKNVSSSKINKVIQLYGGRGMGKATISKKILGDLAQSTEEYTILISMERVKNKETLDKEMKNAARQIQSVVRTEFLGDIGEKEIGTELIKKLRQVESKIAFSIALLPEFKEDLDGLTYLRNIIHEVLSGPKRVKVLLSTASCYEVFTKDEMENMEGFSQVEITGFQGNGEAVNYLTGVPSQKYKGDDTAPKEIEERDQKTPETCEEIGTTEEAEELAKYFDFNPACLKGVKLYCQHRKITYKTYLEWLEDQPARDELHKETLLLLKTYENCNASAYKALHLMDASIPGDGVIYFEAFLEVWKLLHNDYLPVVLISQILYFLELAENQKPSSIIQIRKNTQDLILVLKRKYNITPMKSSGDTISMPKNVHDSLPNRQSLKTLMVAIKAITSLLDKDNRQSGADVLLFQVKDHLDCLCKNIPISEEFNMKAADEDKFELFMKTSRVYELTGQAMVQAKDKSGWKDALGVLSKSAAIVWEGVCSFEKRGLFFLCFPPKTDTDALLYDESSKPEEKAKVIAKHCTEAGKKLFKRGSKYVEEYIIDTLKINESNMDDFIFNCMKSNPDLSEDMARENLKDIIKKPTEATGNNPLPLKPEDIKMLRKTGNLLSIENYCKVFLAERIASIFHIYGRQVLYLKDRMDPKDQKKCEYFASLAHYIAVEIRQLTGFGLLYEYITTSNSIVPRLLQDRKSENVIERMERLENAYKCSKDLLSDPGPMYEEGKYKRVMGTPYTTLNAYKCIVKANCKRLKDQANPFEPSQMSKAECHKLFEIARKNISINMAPNCCIQAMKFFAATGNFNDAFDAFKVGFKSEESGKTYGISLLKERNPNTYIWAICNYLLAIEACRKSDSYDGKIADLERKGKQYYCSVADMETTPELKERLDSLKPI